MKKDKKKMRGINSPSFLGRQLSRLKMGQNYFAIVSTAVSTVSLIIIALSVLEVKVTFTTMIVLIIILLFSAFVMGYLLDVRNINTMDNIEAVDRLHRFINMADLKTQEFNRLQTETLLEALYAMQNKEPINVKLLEEKYKKYLKKWEP